MDTAYSVVAVKYVGFTPAQDAMDALRRLEKDGDADLKQAVAVYRSDDGRLTHYPSREITRSQGALGLGAAGFLLGLIFGKPVRWAALGAVLGLGLAAFITLYRKQEVQATVPYLEKGESVLYMQIRNADWDAFETQMRPYLVRGLPVIQNIEPAHSALIAIIAPPTELQVPPRDDFPAPPSIGVPAPDAGDSKEDSGETDNLTAIKGIGPVIAERLRAGGVHSFARLAGMDVEAIAEIAGVSSARIANGDWAGQAKRLAASS